MAQGDMNVKCPAPKIEGPGGTGSKPNTFDRSAGAKGMRQTYKETGKPGMGKK